MPSDLFPSSDGKKLDSALRGLHATPTAPLPVLSGVVVRSFILEREQGNVIVYNAPGITAARKEILALGPPDRLLLTHWHEAMYGVPELNVPISCMKMIASRQNCQLAASSRSERKSATISR
jgi:hypothetical protein